MTARSGGRGRGSGEGGVYQRASDGRWVGVVDLGWIDGKRRRRTVYGATRAEAVAKLDQLRAERRAGRDLAVQAPTLSQWLDEWLREIKSSDGTRPSTLRRYQEVIRTHLAPGLGRIRVDRLAPRDVQRFLAGRRTTLAPASVLKIHGVLRVALGDAERMGLVTRNVARVVRPARLPRNERPVLTPQEARALLAEARGDRYGRCSFWLSAWVFGEARCWVCAGRTSTSCQVDCTSGVHSNASKARCSSSRRSRTGRAGRCPSRRTSSLSWIASARDSFGSASLPGPRGRRKG